MHLLFICRGNQFRSKIAEAYARRLGKQNWTVASCGTQVEIDGTAERTLSDVGSLNSIAYLRLFGIDVADEIVTSISQTLVVSAHLCIVMAERDTWPDYLRNAPNIIFWDIPNPNPRDFNDAQRIGNMIRGLLDEVAPRCCADKHYTPFRLLLNTCVMPG